MVFYDMSTIQAMNANYRHFAQQHEANEPYVMLIYATWCGHCRNMENDWLKAADDSPDNVPIFRVEETLSKHLMSAHPNNILSRVVSEATGYPTIVGKNVHGPSQDYKFNKAMNADGFAEYFQDISAKAPKKTTITTTTKTKTKRATSAKATKKPRATSAKKPKASK